MFSRSGIKIILYETPMIDADVFSGRFPALFPARERLAGTARLWERFCGALSSEAAYQGARMFVWSPAFVAVGIALYFSLSFEPPLYSGLIPGVVGAVLFFFFRSHFVFRPLLIAFLCVCAGFFAGGVRTLAVHTPILEKETGPVSLRGSIETLEALEEGKGFRAILRDVEIEKLSPDKTPRRVRLKLRAGGEAALRPGQRVRVLAALGPPGIPSLPGGFDFRRYMYFQGIGGVGFAYSKAEILSERASGGPATGPGMARKWPGDFIERLRYGIGERIASTMPAREAAVANALTTGPRAAISEEDNEAVRDSGLAHMLSISGLHIGLFFGVVFFSVRLILACFPAVALRYPIKKVAATAAMAGAIFYTLISGNTVPTQRSILMAGMVFVAIMLDRSPLSMRLVAFSALCLLMISPESLLGASFQMSFSAVAALAAFYEGSYHRRFALSSKMGHAGRLFSYFIGIVLTSLVATFATAPFTLHHFQQLPLYGALANVLAIPVLGFVVMPAAVAAFLLMPLGLEWLVAPFIEVGVAIILAIAHMVAEMNHAVFTVRLWPGPALGLFSVAFVLSLLLRERMKWLALAPFSLFLLTVLDVKQPDILISPGGKVVAIAGHEPLLMVSDLRKERFIRNNWVQAMGLDRSSVERWPAEGVLEDISCGEEGCRLLRNGVKVAFLKKREMFVEECVWADILVAPFSLPPCSGKTVIDRRVSARSGPYALYLDSEKITIENSLKGRSGRPWF